jgi:hypothetical protein
VGGVAGDEHAAEATVVLELGRYLAPDLVSAKPFD